jgi:hypothetical protein
MNKDYYTVEKINFSIIFFKVSEKQCPKKIQSKNIRRWFANRGVWGVNLTPLFWWRLPIGQDQASAIIPRPVIPSRMIKRMEKIPNR